MDCEVQNDNTSTLSLVDLKAKPDEVESLPPRVKSPASANSPVNSQSSKKSNEDSPGRSSPDLHCAICLSRLENKSFTDSCFHQFCFTCLLEWSKVKAECPLCKQSFKSIIHNVRSIEDYDQYYIAARSQDSRSIRSPDGRRFRYPSTLTAERRRQRTFEQTLEYENYRQTFMPTYRGLNARYPTLNRPTTSDFRRRMYENGEWVRIEGEGAIIRYRETSPEFYRHNPACTHRLIPWLNRELIALLLNSENQVNFVLELILALIMRYGIRSEEFYEHILPYLQDRTSHFIHEFYNFARSVYDMATYDELAQYDRLENMQQVPSDNSSPNSIVEVPIESFVSRNVRQRVNKNRTDTANNLEMPSSSSHNSLEDLAIPGPSGTGNTESNTNNNGNHYDSDTDDDCIILQYVKPKGERTPEMVLLMSSSDEEMDDDSQTDAAPSDRPSRKARCDYHYDYSSDSCNERKDAPENKTTALKVRIKSFLGKVQLAPTTTGTLELAEDSKHHRSSHKKHKKHKKHKSHKHRHRHHKKKESKDEEPGEQ